MVKDRLEEFQKKANLTNSDQDDKLPEQFPAQDDKLPEQFPAQDDKLSERKMTNSLKNSLLKVTNFLHRNQPSPSKSTEFLSEEHWEDVENFLDHIKYLNCKIAEMGEDLKHMREINDTILNSPFADPTLSKNLNFKNESFQSHSCYVHNVLKAMNREINYLVESNEAYFEIKKNQILNAERDKKVIFEDVKSRHEDILNLEESIRELHEISQDISMLVESQGEILNDIEANVNSAKNYADRASQHVVYATKRAMDRNIKMAIIPDFFLNTKWIFEKAENTEEILEAAGVPWLIRKLIKGKMESGYFHLTQNGDGYKLESHGSKGNLLYNFKLNEEFEAVGFDGRKHNIKFAIEGEDLVEIHEHLEGPRKGEKDDRFIYRFEHGILICLNSKKNKKGETVTWKKYFKKAT